MFMILQNYLYRGIQFDYVFWQTLFYVQDFQVLILDEAVLALARMYRRDVLVINDEVDVRKANRHQGYRQFVLWQHGMLGAGQRMVIPSCCVWKIRDKFPDAFGQYTGFKPTRLAWYINKHMTTCDIFIL